MSTPNSRPDPGELREVADQGLPGAGILDLDGDRPAVTPDRLVHLPDGRGGGGRVVEGVERRPPVIPEVGGEHPVHRGGRQRRRGLLQLGQRRPVGAGQLGRQRRLEDRQRLAELHRPALELAEHPEDLVRGALLDLLSDDLRRLAPDPPGYPERGPAGEAERQPGKLRAPLDAAPRYVAAPARGKLAHIVILRQCKTS